MNLRGLLAPGSAAALLLLIATPAAAAPQTHVVVMEKMKFGAIPAVKAGDTILWVNKDMFRHTATAKDGSFSIDLPAGAKGKTVIGKAGAIPIFCKYHPGMRGMLKVSK